MDYLPFSPFDITLVYHAVDIILFWVLRLLSTADDRGEVGSRDQKCSDNPTDLGTGGVQICSDTD
jgi:hypothetical protein